MQNKTKACVQETPKGYANRSGSRVKLTSWGIFVKNCQDSRACTRFLCMHNTLVYAQHSCACTTLLSMHWRGQGPRPGPKNKRCQVWRGGVAFFCWVLALSPGPSSACTRVLCMHKSVVHAQESCARTRMLINKPLC